MDSIVSKKTAVAVVGIIKISKLNNTEPHVFVVKQEQEQGKIAAATFAADAIKTGDKKQGPIRRGGKASVIPVTLSKFESVMKTSQCKNFNYNNLTLHLFTPSWSRCKGCPSRITIVAFWL